MITDNIVKGWAVGSVTGAYLLGGIVAIPALIS